MLLGYHYLARFDKNLKGAGPKMACPEFYLFPLQGRGG